MSRVTAFRGPFGVLFLLLAAALLQTAHAATPSEIFGLSWSTPTQGTAAHTYPFVWVTNPSDTSAATINGLVAGAQAEPAGRAAIFIWAGQRAVIGNTADNCIDPTTGQPTTSLCPYLNNGVSAVAAVFTNFYSAYYAAGGPLNFLVLDSEIDLGNYSIANGNPLDPPFSWTWDYVQNDSRFATMLGPALTNMAAAGGYPNLPFTPLTTYVQWAGANTAQDQVWNELMLEWVGADLAAAVYAPMQTFYPNASASDFSYFLHDPSFPTYDYFGDVPSTFGHGVLQGNTGAPELYGAFQSSPSIDIPAGQTYPANPFNAVRYDINNLRAAILGAEKVQGTQQVSVAPWVAFRGYSGSLYANTDYYQEMLFHAALSGASYFLYWNPGGSDHTPNDDPTFDAAMSELTNVVGYSNRQTLVTSQASWSTNYLMTTTQAGTQKVSRLTPAPINSVVTLPACKAEQAGRLLVCTFADGTVIHFPYGSVYKPTSPSSANGVWVVQPISAGNSY